MDHIEIDMRNAARPPRLGRLRAWAGRVWAAKRDRSLKNHLAAQAAHQIASAARLAIESGGASEAARLLEATEKSYGEDVMALAMRARCWRVRSPRKNDEMVGDLWMMTPAMAAALAGSQTWCAKLAAMVPPRHWSDRVALESCVKMGRKNSLLSKSGVEIASAGPLLMLCASEVNWESGFAACQSLLSAPDAAEAQACRLVLADRGSRLAQFDAWAEAQQLRASSQPAPKRRAVAL